MSSLATNTIDRYVQKFTVDYSPILHLCTDIKATYTLKRKDVLEIEFPAVEPIEPKDVMVKSSSTSPCSTDYLRLNSIPPLSALQDAVKKCSNFDSVNNISITMKK